MDVINLGKVWFVGEPTSGKTALIRRLTCDRFDRKQTDNSSLKFNVTHGGPMPIKLIADIIEVNDSNIPAGPHDVIVVLGDADFIMKHLPAVLRTRTISCLSFQDIYNRNTSSDSLNVSAKDGTGCTELTRMIFKMLMKHSNNSLPAVSAPDPISPAARITEQTTIWVEIGDAQFAINGIKPTRIETGEGPDKKVIVF